MRTWMKIGIAGAALALGFACNEPPKPAPKVEPPPVVVPEAAPPVVEVTVPDDQIAVPEDYVAEATTEIDKKNYKAKVADLEKEIAETPEE